MSFYEEIDYKKLETLEAKHSWIVDPIYKKQDEGNKSKHQKVLSE
jgi:hypothetical protein